MKNYFWIRHNIAYKARFVVSRGEDAEIDWNYPKLEKMQESVYKGLCYDTAKAY